LLTHNTLTYRYDSLGNMGKMGKRNRGSLKMRQYELQELINLLEEIKTQAASPSCKQQIQTGIDFYKKQIKKAKE